MRKSRAAFIFFSAAALILIYTSCLLFIVPPLALKKASAIAFQKGYELHVSGWKSSGLNKITFHSLLVVDAESDTIIQIREGEIGYSVFRFLTGHLPVDRIGIDSLTVFKKQPVSENETVSVSGSHEIKTGLASRLFLLEKKLISNLPASVSIRHTLMKTQKKSNIRLWRIFDFTWDGSVMKSLIKTEEGAEIAVNVRINQNRGNYELGATMQVPRFIPAAMDSHALQFSFRSATLFLKKDKWSKSEIHSQCRLKSDGLQVYHWRISQDTVKINRFETRKQIVIDDHSITVAPESSMHINDISINTEFKIARKENVELNLKAEIHEMPAQVFFNSLPGGLFQSFNGIKAGGEIGYALNFSADLSMPDSLIFESTFNGRKLKIQQFGEVNPYRLNEPFEQTVYERGRPVRRIVVGNENHYFVSYAHIPAALVNSVLTAEDGSFFGHAGFNEEAFRQSIITNLKERRFARGGSTITMQLVKNLYLGRDKNISRKMEEALWVWLIENKRMVSKERMIEIYLNIIEWGPDVYGIGEAAQYYFNKKADQLTLNECIFLAGIIPNPKYFRYAFDKEGNLRNYFQSFFRIVSERLLMKEKITEQEFLSVNPSIKLTGRASVLVMPADSLPDFDAAQEEEDVP